MNTKLKTARSVLEKELGAFTFAIYLRGARTMMDLSQVEMAKILGIAKGTLCDIEKGRQLVSPLLAMKIAKKAKLSEVHAVKVALQDQLNRAKIKMRVEIVA